MDTLLRSLIRSYIIDPSDELALQILRATIQSNGDDLLIPLARHAVDKLLSEQNLMPQVTSVAIYPQTAQHFDQIFKAIAAKDIFPTGLLRSWEIDRIGCGLVSFLIHPKSASPLHFRLVLDYCGDEVLMAFEHASQSQFLKNRAIEGLECWLEYTSDNVDDEDSLDIHFNDRIGIDDEVENISLEEVFGPLRDGHNPIGVKFYAELTDDGGIFCRDRQFIYRNAPGVQRDRTTIAILTPE